MAPNTKQRKLKKCDEEILDARAGSFYCVGLAQVLCEHKYTFHFIQLCMCVCVCVCVCVSELEGAELLVDGQDVVVELCREQQVLQGSHVLLDGHMVLQSEERRGVIEGIHTSNMCYCRERECVCVNVLP